MSQSTIDRWNAIPLERQKRSRTPSDKDDDTDDDVSLVSRTPSPEPVVGDLTEYDKYHRGYEREVITVETKLKETNIGHKMLQKMGWREGEGLGMSGQGRPDPIPFKLKSDLAGLGKTTQDVRMIALTVAQRRDLDSERQSRETEAQKKAREDKVAKKEAIKSEITTTLRPFYCELCDKQYRNVTQYDEHTRSYAHTHKQRFREMEAAQKPKDLSKAREKERKREEKELKRLAAATGVKLAAAPAASLASVTPAVAPIGGSKGSGWGSTFKQTELNSVGFKKSGWAAVASPVSTSTSYTSPNSSGSGLAPAEPFTSSTGPMKGGWASTSASTATDSPAPPLPPTEVGAHISSGELPPGRKLPTFTRGGFTNLDTTSEPIAALNDLSIRSTPSSTGDDSRASSWAPARITNALVLPSPPSEPAAPPPPAPPSTAPPPPPPLDAPPSPPGDLSPEYGNRLQNASPERSHDALGNFGYNGRPGVPHNDGRHSEPWPMDVDGGDRYGQSHSRSGSWQSERPPYSSDGYDQEAGRPGYGYGTRGTHRGYQSLRGQGYGRGRGYYGGDGRR